MTADALARDPELGSYPLRCDMCGRAVECTPADVYAYASLGPPACCGHPMLFPAVPPIPAFSARPGRRRQGRPGATVHLRRAGGSPEPVDALVDVSANGLGVRLVAVIAHAEQVEVTLRAPGGTRTLVLPGEVRWCRPVADGRFQAGIYLLRSLTATELDGLGR